MAREGIIDVETALAYATNPGNLRLVISDLMEEPNSPAEAVAPAAQQKPAAGAEAEIVRF
jgi:hypothetical protein